MVQLMGAPPEELNVIGLPDSRRAKAVYERYTIQTSCLMAQAQQRAPGRRVDRG